MSNSAKTADNQAAVNDSAYTKEETVAAIRIFIALALFVAVGIAAFLIWGLPALTIIALGMAVAVLVLLVAYAAGV